MANGFDEQEATRLIARESDAARAFLGADGETATALLPIFHALQEAFGYVDARAMPMIADALNISLAEVRGTLSFYHDYRTAPGGARTLKICRAEACQSVGCERIAAHLADRHGLKPGGTMPNGSLTLENVYCLGNCALGPAVLLDDELVGRVDEARIDEIVAGVTS